MKTLLLASLLILIGLQTFSISPVTKQISFLPQPIVAANHLNDLAKFTPRKYYELTGKRLSLKQKIALTILKSKLKRQQAADQKSNLGLLSLIFGGSAFIIAFVPGIGILSLGLAIAAIVLGIIGLNRKKGDTKSIIGLVLGSAFLFLIVIAIATLLSWGIE